MTTEVLGNIATIASLVFVAMGLPDQIRKIYRAKSTEGVSFKTQITLLVCNISWCAYGLKISNGYILIPNAAGTICVFIIVCQFWVYRRRKGVRV